MRKYDSNNFKTQAHKQNDGNIALTKIHFSLKENHPQFKETQ